MIWAYNGYPGFKINGVEYTAVYMGMRKRSPSRHRPLLEHRTRPIYDTLHRSAFNIYHNLHEKFLLTILKQ
jgi:hypothetical protein